MHFAMWDSLCAIMRAPILLLEVPLFPPALGVLSRGYFSTVPHITLWPAAVSRQGVTQSGPCREGGLCLCLGQVTELSFLLEKVDPASCFSQSHFRFIFVIYNVIFVLIFSF